MDTPTGYRRIETSLRGLARGARRVGDADPRETFSVSMRVRRQSGAPPLPGQDHWAVTPIGKRRFLSRQQFAAQYGAAQEDLDRVANFARSQGLTVLESSIARRTVVVSGTAEQMSRAFAVELGHYESPEGSYRGREGYIHLPNDVADLITGVFGLDNRRVVSNLHWAPTISSVADTPQASCYALGLHILQEQRASMAAGTDGVSRCRRNGSVNGAL
jgi:kumamolisin